WDLLALIRSVLRIDESRSSGSLRSPEDDDSSATTPTLKNKVGDRPPQLAESKRSSMAKKVTGFVKLQIPAGKANPAPPVGTALGPQGINIMAFCKEFNSRTQGQDTILPVEITIYSDKSFTFITKTPPAAVLLKKEAGIEKGSGQPNRN